MPSEASFKNDPHEYCDENDHTGGRAEQEAAACAAQERRTGRRSSCDRHLPLELVGEDAGGNGDHQIEERDPAEEPARRRRVAGQPSSHVEQLADEERTRDDVFLVSATKMLISGGMTVRNAWGRITVPRLWPNVIPIDRAASAWPVATLLMPDRTASQTNAAV